MILLRSSVYFLFLRFFAGGALESSFFTFCRFFPFWNIVSVEESARYLCVLILISALLHFSEADSEIAGGAAFE